MFKLGISIPSLRTRITGGRSRPYRKDRWRFHFIFVVIQVERKTVTIIKFVTEWQLVCIAVEEDMTIATSSGAPYVETDEKAMECVITVFRSTWMTTKIK